MPIEVGIWRIDDGLTPLIARPLDRESRLQEILAGDLSILSPDLLLIGREVSTNVGKRADMLAINSEGHLVVLELKRDRTPREVVAQLLDYGSWIVELEAQDIASIYEAYIHRYRPDLEDESLDDAYRRHFKVEELPETLNESHELVVVASYLDPSTERIVRYLHDHHDVRVNAVFFRIYQDENREYLTRAWLSEPGVDLEPPVVPKGENRWNGEFYVSYGGGNRDWEDARRLGFISAGGGTWYSNTLKQLQEGARIWVNIPRRGYVGVGYVKGEPTVYDDFMVVDHEGKSRPVADVLKNPDSLVFFADDPERAEYFVPIEWQKTVALEDAVKEKGFFGNQNSVAKPRKKKWEHTVERLKKAFEID